MNRGRLRGGRLGGVSLVGVPFGGALLWAVAAGIPAAFLGLFYLFPLWSILAEIFSFDVLWDVWSSKAEILWFTAWQAAVSTLLTLLAAFPMAYVLGKFSFKGKSQVRALLLVPFVLPTVVVAAAMTAVFDRFGVRDFFQHSLWAILLAHVFFNFAVVARTLGAYWSQLSDAPEEAALTLGAGAWRTFRKVTLPRLAPALWGISSIVFLFCFTSFGVILILGGPGRATLDTEIWRQATLRQEFPTAAALVVLQLLAVVAVLAINSRWAQRTIVPERLLLTATRRAAQSKEKLAVGGALLWSALLLGVPMLTLIERSFAQRGGGYSLSAYRGLFRTSGQQASLFVKPGQALRNSLETAAIAMAIAVLVGVLAALAVSYLKGLPAKALDAALLLPLGTSAVALGFGLLLALDTDPVNWRFSWWLIPVAHALVGIPFVLRGVAPVLRSIPPDMRASARLLGASQLRLWRDIDLPLASRAILSSAGFAFAISLGEFGASAFLVRPDRPTVPVTIFRLLNRPGELAYSQALALSVILMLVIAVVVLGIERFRSETAGAL